MKENKGTINIQAEKIRRLQKVLEYRTLELKGAKSEIDILKFKLEKQKEKNRKAGGLIAGLKHELKETREQNIRISNDFMEVAREKVVGEPRIVPIQGGKPIPRHNYHMFQSPVEVKVGYMDNNGNVCRCNEGEWDVNQILSNIITGAGLGIKNQKEILGDDKVDSISRAVEALEKKNEEKRREETGDELILKGLIKTLQDVKDSRNQFEINITNEKRTGFLGHTIETGREIATIKYHKPGKGVLNIKKLEGE